MGKILNIAIGIVLAAVLVAGGLLGWSHLKPPEDFVGSKLEKDLKEWLSYVDKEPTDPLGRANLGAVYLEMGEIEKGTKELELAVDLGPEGYTYLLKLGEAYRTAGRNDEAVDMFKQALEKYPEGEKFLPAYQLAEIYFEQGDLASAKDFAQQAVDGSTGIWNAHYLLGQVYEREGDKGMAKKEYEKAAEFNPNSPELQEALARVSS
ncbi:MAG: tetratricopeptide repeat protein [Thermoleophilia bacterium]